MSPWWIECPASGRVAVCPRPRGGDWLEDDLRALRAAGVEVLVSALTESEERELELIEEQRFAEAVGLRWMRLPVGDFGVPHLGSVAVPLTELVGGLREGGNVAVHCRMGVGRSPLFAACMLVGLGVTPDEAWRLVEAARGVRVSDTEAQRAWVETWKEWWATNSVG